ncbi:MAG: carbohydrate kinase [Clostridiales bacterium]|jgi:fructokinase|nr:carbohydrate kinase [Clostridiales bacterium]
METDIVALGELLIDFTEYGKSDAGMRLFEQNPGGAVANVVCAGARLGLSTAFIGKVGSDIHGEFLSSALKAEGVDVRNLILDDKRFTTMAFVALSGSGERSFGFFRNGSAADTSLRAEDIDRELIKNSKILHIGTISMTHEPARNATLAAVETARGASALISCDVNFRAGLWESEELMLGRTRALLPMVDFLKISGDEAKLLTGESDPELSSRILMQTYPLSVVAVTLGEKGALVRTPSGIARVCAVQTTAVDTTGAGDCFWASFLYAFLVSGIQYKNIGLSDAEKYARFAAAAASICVESRGAIPAMPQLNAVLARMKQRADSR